MAKSTQRILSLLLLLPLLLLPGCGKKDASGKYALSKNGEAILDEGYDARESPDNARVFYEIFVGSFSDSDGDGTGDLRGVINRMDYLNDGDPASGLSLGIEGIWLTPIFKSSSYHKYDVNDYYTIDPDFGTMEDLEELIDLCHERGVKLILDLPINHTGRLNHWFGLFTEAHRRGNTQDPYYSFYSYYTKGEPVPAGRTFAPLSGTEDYYECNFSGDMPELNFDSDAVRDAVLEVAKTYLDLGVDGFRFDAAKYIYFGDNTRSEAFWEWYIRELKSIDPDIYTVAEVWDADAITDLYSPALNCFDFTVSQTGLIAETAKKGNVSNYTAYVDSYVNQITALREDAMYLPFIANHDTDRAAGYLSVNEGQMQMAANLYLLGPGSPFLYYGEEIGLKGSRGGANTDANRRLAMLWGDGDTVKDPTGSSYKSSNQLNGTVAEQLGDGDSLLSHYKRLLMIRKANPEIARGDYEALPNRGQKWGGFISTYEGSSVLVLHNPTTEEVTIELGKLSELPFTELAAAIGASGAELKDGTLVLGAQTSCVLRTK